jgi:hypothetical protein
VAASAAVTAIARDYHCVADEDLACDEENPNAGAASLATLAVTYSGKSSAAAAPAAAAAVGEEDGAPAAPAATTATAGQPTNRNTVVAIPKRWLENAGHDECG